MHDIVLDSKQKNSYKSSNKVVSSFVRTILLSLILGALISLDFILYLRSGSVFVLKDNFNFPVLYVIAGIFVFSFGLMVLSSLFKTIQKFLFAVVCAALLWGFMSQFLQIDKSQYLSILLSSLLGIDMLLNLIDGYSHWVLIGLAFVLSYSFVKRVGNRSLFYLTGILLLLLGGEMGTAMISSVPQKPVNEVYASQETNFPDNHKKTIFFFMPNLMSSYIGQMQNDKDSDHSQKYKQVMLGFLETYGFRLYPNAYVVNDFRDANLVESLNVLDNKSYVDHVMNNVGLEKLWNFNSAQKTDVFLQDNQLVNVFKKAHFKLSGYQNKRFEICKQNNQFIVDRCVSRSSQPFDITAFGFSDFDRAEILFYQWIHSLDIFTRLEIVDVLKIFMERETALKMALPYDQMYVVGSFDILKQVLQDIASDKSSAGAYFVYLDFPNNLFVFNEQCHLKPYNQWVTDNPKFKVGGTALSLKNYNSQMICFWKQMDDFMQALQKLDENQELTFIIQGISNAGENNAASVNFVDKFKKQNSVLLAIRDAKGQFQTSYEFCQAKEIVRNYLFKSSRCVEFKGLQFSKSSQETIKNQLRDLSFTPSELVQAKEDYRKIMQEWKVQHQPLFNVTQTDNEEEKPAKIGDILSEEAAKALTDGKPLTLEDEGVVQSNTKFTSQLSEKEIKVDDVPLEKNQEETEQSQAEAAQQAAEQAKAEVQEIPATSAQQQEEQPKTATPSEAAQAQPVQQVAPVQQPVEEQPKPAVQEAPVAPAQQQETAQAQPAQQVAPVQQPVEEQPKPAVQEAPAAPAQQQETAQAQPVQQVAPVQQPVEEQPKTAVQEAPVAPAQQAEQPEAVAPAEASEGQVVHKVIVEDVPASQQVIHYETTEQPAVSGDFLLQAPQEEWEFDPAQALGVSGEPQERIIVKVK